MPLRNRQNPRQKRQVYFSAEVAAEIDAAAFEAGLSIGQFLDRVWLERRPGRKTVNASPPADEPKSAGLPHIFDLLIGGGLKVCRFCRNGPKSEIGQRPACPDRRE